MVQHPGVALLKDRFPLAVDQQVVARVLEPGQRLVGRRHTLVEDPRGKLWLYTLNMDLMIYGGRPLPADIKEEALNVRKVILEIMERGAEGDF